MPEYLGYIGGMFTTFCYIPQIIRVFRLKSAKELSLTFSIMLLVGVAAWLAYGIFFSLAPVIIWNSITAVIVAVLLFAKLKYGR